MHDQGPLAWIVVLGYFVDCALALGAAAVALDRERRFWIFLAVAMLLLGINKQLDLQTDLTVVARAAAQSEGWYGLRRDAQGAFILFVGLAAFACSLLVWRWLRQSHGSVKLAGIGLMILLAFIFIRAASFHHIDQWVTVRVVGLRSGWWLELVGIVVIGVSAAAYRRRESKSA